MYLKLTLSDSTAINSEIITDTIKKTEIYYNKLSPADNSCKFDVPFDINLSNKIKADIDNNIKAQIVNDDGSNWFYGYVRKTASFEKTQTNQPISLELVSPSYFLDVDLTTDIYLANVTIDAIITRLFSESKIGITPVTNINITISIFTASEGDNIYDLLKELLFEYGYAFDFDNNGSFVLYELFNKPTTITQQLDGTNCRDKITQNKNEQECDYVVGKWNKYELLNNQLLFSDTTGKTACHNCVITVKPNAYFADNEVNYLKYDCTKGNVIYCTEITGDRIDCPQGLTKTLNNLGTKAELSIKNNTSGTITITNFEIYGNAYINTSSNESVSTTGEKKKEFELKYIHDKTTADNLVKNLADYYRYADFTVKTTSKDNFPIGSFIKVTDSGIGTINGRIIKKETNYYDGNYDYEIEAISEYTPSEISKSKININGNSSASMVTVRDLTPPTVPVLKSATINSNGTATIIFEPSTDNESGVNYYKLYRKLSNEVFAVIAELNHTGNNITYIDGLLKKGNAYSYCVSAVDNSGNVSEQSNSLSITAKVSQIPNQATGLTATANNADYIKLNWTGAIQDDEENKAKSYRVDISKDEGTTWTTAETNIVNNYYYYYFNNEYPETADLQKYKFRVYTISVNDIMSTNATETTVDTTDYKTWKAGTPIISATISGRCVLLNMAHSNTIYGNRFKYRVQIKKISDTADTEFYKPDISSDPYSNILNYKIADDTGYIETEFNNFQQTLPLNGQNETEPLPINTTYQYKITILNEAGVGDSTTISLTAMATGARDITASAITNNKIADGTILADKIHASTITGDKIATTNLATNNAVLGNISGTAIDGGSNNYWKNLDTANPEFRIGNDINLETTGSDDAEYLHYSSGSGIVMKVKNFLLTSLASVIRGVFKIRGKTGDYTTDASPFLTVNPENTIDEVTSTPAETMQVNGKFKSLNADITNGNITNGNIINGNITTLESPVAKIANLYLPDNAHTALHKQPVCIGWVKFTYGNSAITSTHSDSISSVSVTSNGALLITFDSSKYIIDTTASYDYVGAKPNSLYDGKYSILSYGNYYNSRTIATFQMTMKNTNSTNNTMTIYPSGLYTDGYYNGLNSSCYAGMNFFIYEVPSSTNTDLPVTDTVVIKGDTGAKGDKGDKGDTGATGPDGASLINIEQTTTSAVSGGTNVITATLADGSTHNFNIKNGNDVINVPFAVCSSDAASQAKEITLSGITISDSVAVKIYVKFTHANTAGTITTGGNTITDASAPYLIINGDTTKQYKIQVAGENAGPGFCVDGEVQSLIIYGGISEDDTAINIYNVVGENYSYRKQRDGQITCSMFLMFINSLSQEVTLPISFNNTTTMRSFGNARWDGADNSVTVYQKSVSQVHVQMAKVATIGVDLIVLEI